MFRLLFCSFFLSLAACSSGPESPPAAQPVSPETVQLEVTAVLDSFHAAAARADYEAYFGYFTSDATFMGTDATEHWNKPAFMEWAKPYFDRGKAWSFTALERHIYVDSTASWVWFDELLNTQMKICRGSGVAVRQGGDWKIRQYVLSMTVPNEQVDSAVSIKAAIEDSLILELQKRQVPHSN